MSEDTTVIIDDTSGEVTSPREAGADHLPEGAVQIDARTVEYTLLDPVEIIVKVNGRDEKQNFASIRLKRFRGKDLMDIEAAPAASKTIVAFARSLGLPDHRAKALYEQMDQDDVSAVATIILGFNGSGRRTGQ